MTYLRVHSRLISHCMVLLMAFWQVAGPLQAATVYLDTNGTTAGSGIANGATVTWDTSAIWTPGADGTGTSSAWAPGDIAVFSAGTDATGDYTVAVSGTQSIGGLNFRSGNVSLSGGTLSLASASIFDVGPGLSAGVSSLLAGAVGLTKTGAGTLVLSGANAGFSGPVLLSRGTLGAQTEAAALGTGALTLAGGTLALANDTGLTFGNNTTVTGSSRITVDRLTSGAGVTHTLGTLTIGPQKLSIQAGANVTSGTAGLIFGATTLTASGTIFDVASGASLTLGAIGGNFNVFKTGGGTLTLSGASARAASTTYISGGTVVQTNVAGLGTSAAILNLSGGATLDLATDTTTNAYVTTLIGNATVLSNLAASGAGTTHTLGALTSLGANTLSINKGANVTGTGTVAFGAATTTGATTFQVGSGAQLTLASTLNNAGYTSTFSGAGNATVTGVISGGGGLTMNSTGLLTLTAANTYGGVTTLNSGTVQLGTVTSLGAAATASTVMTGSSVLNTNGLAVGIMSLSGTSGTTLQNGHASTAATLSLSTGANATSSFAGTIQNGGVGTMGVTLNGTGALTLSGNNTYTGATTLTAGRLNINSATALGAATSVFTLTTGIIDNTSGSAKTLSNNNAVTLGGNFTFGGSNSLNFGTGTWTTTSSRAVTLMGSTGSVLTLGTYNSNAASLTSTVRVLPGANSTLSIGTFNAQGSGTAGTTVLFGNGNLAITGGIQPTITAAAMNFSSTGTITLTGASTYTGATTFTSGTVVLDATAGTATMAASLPTFSGGAFIFKGNSTGTGLTLGNLALGTGGSTLKVVGGAAGTALTLGTTTVTTNNGTLNIVLDSTLGAAAATTTSITATNGILGGANARAAVLVTIGSSTEFATISSSGTNRGFLQYTAQTPFTGTTTGTATNYSVTGTQTLSTAASTPNSVKIITSGTGQSLDLGANTMQITSGGLLFVGANDYEIKGSAVNALRSASATNSDLIVHNYGAGELNISAAIANGTGVSVVTISGPGVTKLSGANTYTGVTHVTGGGTLSIGANTALGAVATGAGLVFNNGTLRATSTFALDNAGANIRLITLNAGGGTFDVTGSNTLSALGVISGTGSLTKTGTGTLFLSTGVSTYSGGFTSIEAGTLQIGGAAGSIAATNLIVLGSATNTSGRLMLGDASNAKTQVIAGLLTQGTGTANAVVGGNAANSTLTYTGTVAIPTTFSGTLGGAGTNENNLALSITAGQLTLNGSNTYTGGTTLSGGILNIDSATALGTGALTLTGGSIDNTSGAPITLSANNAVALNGNVIYGASNSLNFGSTSIATMGASRSVTLLGGTASTSVLSFGTVNFTAAAVTLTVSALQGSGTALNIGTLDLNTGTAGTAGIITGNGNINITNKITATTAAQAFTYSGTGILTLSGSASDYGGLTTLSGAGTVRLGPGGSLPSASGLTITSGTFDLNGQNQAVGTLTLTSPATITNTSGTASTFTAANVAASTGHLAGNLSGNFTLTGAAAALSGTYTNTGSLTFTNNGTGAFTVSGTVLNGGNVTFNANNAQAFTVSAPLINPTGLITNSGTGTGATTISGNIGSNVTGVTQNSATSQLTLSGVNTYTGPTNVTLGTLVLPRTSALYNNTPASWTAANLTIGTGGLLALNVGGAGEFTSSDLDLLLALGNGTGGFLNGSAIGLDTTNATGANFTYSNVIANTNGGASALGLVKRGTGTLTLTAANTYSGGTTVNGGTLSLSADNNLGASTGGLALNAAGLQITGTGFNSLSASRAFSVSGATTFDIVDSANVFTLNYPLTPGALTKTGAGALTLAGTITTSSNIAVTAGVLNLQGAVTGSPTASVLTYGTVAGNSVVNVSNDMTLLATRGANIAGAMSIYNQTAGTVTVAPGNGNSQYVAAAAGYGYFNLTGGTYRGTGTTPRFNVTAGSGTGVAYIGGTGTLDYAGGEYLLIAYNGAGALGQLTVADTAVVNRNGATQPLAVFWTSAGSYGVLNVAGGSVDNTGKTVVFGGGTVSNQTGFVNLSAGTLTANGFVSSTGSGTGNLSYVNFAGGTYQAGAAHTLVGADSSGNIVRTTLFGAINNSAIGGPSFNGGAVIDTNGFDVLANRAFTGATGTAVTQANITIPTTGNTGYIGAPAVQFSAPAGGGVPASGYALISAGQVTGIVITNPGTYASGDTPTITFTGGGGAITPFATSALTTANTGSGLTKTGLGTLSLTAVNTYTGATTVNGGTLSVAGISLPNTSALVVGSTANASFDLFADGTGTAWNLLAGANITLGSATTSGSLGFHVGSASDSIIFNGGTLTINAGGGFIDAVGLTGFAVGQSYTVISNANIVGGANLRLGNLPSGYQYSLNTTATNVTLNVLGLAPSGNLYWTGQVNGNWGGVSNWSALTDGSTVAGYGPGGNNVVYFSATNAGSATIATELDLPVSIQGLKIINSSTGAVSIAPGAAGTLTLGSAGVEIQSGAPASTTISAPIVLGSAQTWSVASGTSLTASGIIAGGTTTGTLGLTISGGGTVSLSGVSTFTGDILVDGAGTTLSATVSQLNNADASSPLGAAGAHTYTIRNGATFTLLGANTLNPTAGSAKSFVVGSGGATFEVNNSGGTITLDDAGQFAIAAGATLTKTGAGVLVLGGNYDSSIAAGASVVVNAGTLRLQNVNALGGVNKMPVTLAGGTTVDIRLSSGGTFGNNVTVTGDATISTGRGTASSATITQVLGTLTIGSNTLTQSNGSLNTAPGVANLTFGATTLTGNPVFNVTNVNGSGLGTLTLGSITESGGARSVTKAGAGILLLSGTSLYTGTTTVTGGILQLASQVSLYNNNTAAWTSSNIVVGSGAGVTLAYGGTGEFTADNVAALTALGTASGGFMTGSSVGLDTTNAGGSATYDRNIANPNGGANVLGFIKSGAGTLTLSGTNTYTGRTIIYGGALAGNIGGSSLQLSGGVYEGSGNFSRALGTGAGQVQWIAAANGGFSAAGAPLTVSFTGAPSPLVWDSTANFVTGVGQLLFGSTTADNAVTLTHNIDFNDLGVAVTRTVQVLDNTAVTTDRAVLSGVLSGGVNATLAKTGAGVLELTGASTYSGPTTNTTGTLIFSGSNSSAGTVTLTSGTLQLNGTSNGGMASGLLTLTAGTLQALNATRTLSNSVLLTAVTVSGTQNLTLNGTVTGVTGGNRTLTSSITGGTLTLGAVAINNDATATRTLTIAGTGNTVLGGVISNGNADAFANALSITSAGTTSITGANTYTGATTVNNATAVVSLSGAGRLSTGALTVNAGTLNLSTALDQTVTLLTMGGGAAGSASSITIATGRTLTATGGVTYSATNNPLTAVIGGLGTLDLGAAGVTVNIGNSTAVDVDMSWAMNTVTGSGAFIKDGAGTLDIRSVTNYNYAATSYQINGGAILGLGALTTNLILNGGVYEGSGTFTRSLGTGSNQVQWLALGGGFSARGGDLTVTLAGAPSPLVWGGTTNFVPSGAPLIFGSTTADSVVTFTHDIDLNGLARTVQVVDNAAVTADRAVLSGVLSGTSPSGITKTGTGTLALSGANTFTGGITVTQGTLEFSTVNNNGGAASNLGQGTDGITLAGGTLSFVGDTTSQSTNRAITTTASSTLSANGTNGASITYAGAITTGTDFTLTLTGTASGTISGGITQPAGASTADLTINSGNWTITGTNSSIADDVLLNGGTLNLVSTTLFLNDDLVVSGPTAVLNLNSSNVFAPISAAGTSSGLYSRGGAIINLNANDVNGVANANGMDFIFLAEASTPGVGTLNTNTFNITTPRVDLGAIADTFTGVILGTGTITGTSTVTDYSSGFRLFRGSISANLAGVSSILKQGIYDVTLTGNNSGLTSTVAATRIDSGNLILDYTTDNNTKLSTGAALDMRGGTLTLQGGVLANTTQNVLSFTLASGGSNVINVSSLGGFTTTLSLGAITRANSAGTILFTLGTSGSITTTTANNATTGLLGTTGTAFATIMDGTGTYFAVNNGSGVIVPLTYAAAKNDVTTWLAGDHVTSSGSGFTGTVNRLSINSLRFNAPVASTVNIGTLGVLTIGSGGILQTSTVTGGASVITGGRLVSGTNELVITTDSATSVFRISSYLYGITALAKAGSGILLLDSVNHASGSTNIQNGTLRVSGGSAIGDRSTVTLSDDHSALLELLDDETIGPLAGGSATTGLSTLAEVAIGAHSLTINAHTASTYSGLITGDGRLIKTGTTTFSLGGASAFTGDLIVNQGQVTLATRTIANLTNVGSVTLNAGSLLLDFTGGTESSPNKINNSAPITLINTGGIDGIRANNDRTDASKAETLGVVTFLGGANTITASESAGTPTADRTTTITASSLVRSNRSTLLVRGQNLGTITAGVTGAFIASGRVVSTALPTLLGGAGAAGTTTISILPWAIGGTSLTSTGTSFVTAVATTGFRPLDLTTEYEQLVAAGGITLNNNVRLSAASDLTLDGTTARTMNSLLVDNTSTTAAITFAGAGASLNVASGALLFTGSATPQGITLSGFSGITSSGSNEYVLHVSNTAAAGVTIASPFTTSFGSLTKSGAGTLILTATGSTYTGPTTVNQGILQIDSLNKLGNLGSGGLYFNAGTLRFGAAFDLSAAPVIFGVTATGTVETTSGGTLDTNGFDVTLASSIGGGGNGGLTKAGTGTLTLNAVANYGGATAVNAGTLAYGISNALPTTTDLTLGAATLAVGANSASLRGFTLTGAGFITGSAPVTFTGPAVNTGAFTLTVNNSAATVFNGAYFFLAEAVTARAFTLAVTGTGTVTINSAIVDGGAPASSLSKTGAGTLQLTGANSYAGTTSNATGTLILSGSNDTTGGTTLTSGTLQLDSASNGGLASGTLTLTAGTLQALTSARTISNNVSLTAVTVSGTQDLTINGLLTGNTAGGTAGSRTLTSSITGGTLTLANVDISNQVGTARTLTIAGTGNTTVNGVISDGVGMTTANPLTITSTGVTILNGANTYTGLTTMNAATGTLRLAGSNNSAGATTLTTGTLQFGSATALASGLLTLTAGTIDNVTASPLTLTTNNAVTLAGNITFGGTNDLNLGNGTVSNSGSRTITLNGTSRTLTLGAMTNTLATANTMTVNGAGNTLAVGSYALSNTATSLVDIIAGSANVTITGAVTNGGTATASGLSYTGTGTLTLGGNNTYAGLTTLNNAAGKLRLSGSNNTAGGTTVTAGTLQLDSASNGGLASGTLVLTAATLEALNAARVIANNVTLTAATVSGSQALTINGTVTATGAADRVLTSSITGQTLTLNNVNISDNASSRTLTIAGTGNTTVNGTIANGTATTGALAITNTATTTLTVANTYTGTTTVSAGVLAISHGSALGGITNGTSVASGATVQLSNNITVTGEALSLTAGADDAVLRNASDSNVWTGNVTVNTGTGAGRVRLQSDAGNLRVSGNINLSAGTQDFVVGGNGDGEISGQITGSQRLFKSTSGTGTWILSGNNSSTFTGKTAIGNGAIQIASEANLGAVPGTYVADQLTLGGASTQGTLKTSLTMALSANRGITIGAGGGAIETAAATTATFNSVITGDGELKKEGVGTLIFTAVNTNTGLTSVNAGILGGTGTVGGNLIVNSSGTLAPGVTNAGVLTVTGNLVVNVGGTLSNELGGATFNAAQIVFNEMNAHGNLNAFIGNLPSTDWENYISGSTAHDHIQINGASASLLNGTVKVSALFGGFNPAYGDIFDMMDWTFAGDLTGAPIYDFTGVTLDPGLAFNTDLFLSNGIIVVVPEPSRALFLLLGLLGLMVRRRRQC